MPWEPDSGHLILSLNKDPEKFRKLRHNLQVEWEAALRLLRLAPCDAAAGTTRELPGWGCPLPMLHFSFGFYQALLGRVVAGRGLVGTL